MITDHSWPLVRAAAGLYVLQRSTQASITSGKRFRYENTSRLRWLPPVQTLPGLPEGGGVAVGAEWGYKDRETWDSGRGRGTVWVRARQADPFSKVLVKQWALRETVIHTSLSHYWGWLQTVQGDQIASGWWSAAASSASFKQAHNVFLVALA